MKRDSTHQKVIAIVQARMSSSRLPGKVLLDIGGKPMLARVIDRSRRAKWVDEVIVATTTEEEDTPIAVFCQQYDVPYYRGSQFDVLDRYYQTAKQFHADVIVRITADCPLIDPQLMDEVIEDLFFWKRDQSKPLSQGEKVLENPFWDFAANRLPPPWKRTYPIGLDTEVVTFAALERAWREAQQP
ncbi:MAG: cytidylyltransferase domain-containing protein, partial [Anaerolineales bacterium]